MEFAFLKKGDTNIDFGDEIAVFDESNYLNSKQYFLVSNDEKIRAQIVAPELDFAVRNYKKSDISRVLSLLFEARAVGYDYGKEIIQNAKIGNKICILGENEELKNELKDNGYEAICVNEFDFIYGGVGSLCVVIKDAEIECDLCIISAEFECEKYQNASKNALFFASNYAAAKEWLERFSGMVSFVKHIDFNASLCQLDGRRSEQCGWCVNACPSTAIMSDENQIILSEIDCVACGKCVAACPTNSLECNDFTRDSFWQSSLLFRDEKIALIEDFASDFALGDFVPFYIRWGLIDELILLHLLNISKRPLLICGEISEFLAEKITLINDISMAIGGKKAIYVNIDSAKVPDEKLEFLASEEKNFRLNKRELFGKKLLSMIKDNDFGVVKAKNYAKISINPNTCTLCASCVGACNTGALFANSKNNSIEFNASLCTNCGYCVKSCAEKDTIFINSGEISLQKSAFTHQELVRDELFCCLECGKEFATTKSIKKIASVLSLAFKGDVTKEYSLYCCADCKAKIAMLKQAYVFDDLSSFFAPLEQKLNAFLGEFDAK